MEMTPGSAMDAGPCAYAGWTHAAFPLDHPSRVGEARRFAVAACQDRNWTDNDLGRLGLVVTELGTNLLKHAAKGRLLIAHRAAHDDVEVISLDEGPGIADVGRSMRDGFSTGSTPGNGLGAVKRLADDFDIHSAVPDGTVCLARVRRRPDGRVAVRTRPVPAPVAIGAICLSAPGESTCGDGWAAAVDGAHASVLVADGLGHGPEAARASAAAVEAHLLQPFGDMRLLLERTHVALKATRGAAICQIRLDAESGGLRCIGAGNVMVRLVSGVVDKTLATQNGTAGVQIRKPQETSIDLPPHALTIIHSDGIESRWDPRRILPLLARDPALTAAVVMRDHTRHRDDATIVVLQRIE